MNQLIRMIKFQSNANSKIGRNRVKICSRWAKTHSHKSCDEQIMLIKCIMKVSLCITHQVQSDAEAHPTVNSNSDMSQCTECSELY